MKGYRVAKPGDYQTIVSLLEGGDPSSVLIYQPETKSGHPLLELVQGPFEAFERKFTCYSMKKLQHALTICTKRPYELEINGSIINGGPYQLLIKT